MSDAEPPANAGNLFQGDVSARDGGTFNAFAGDQNNYNLTVNALRRRVGYTADPERLENEMRFVVSPPGIGDHLASLRETRLLVLAGGTRTGLSTGARHRWQTFASERPELHSAELFASEHTELLEEIAHVKGPSVLLLDISHDPQLATQLPDRFAQVQAALHEHDSRMVIAVGNGAYPASRRALRESVHRLGRPDPVAVMEKRMERRGLLQELRANERFMGLVADLWPPRAVEIAELLDRASPQTELGKLIDAVASQVNSWSEELRHLLDRQLTGGESRALLLATSALEGAGRDSISLAASDLAEVAGEEVANPSVLADRSLDQQFAELESVLVPGTGRFKNAGYGEAVLPFAWAQFPTWRTPIRIWLDLLLRPRRLDDDTLAVLLPRLLAFASATGTADLVTLRAASIAGASGEGTRLRRDLAAGLLLAGAVDSSVGQQVRRQLWQWSYHRSGVPNSVQRTVAQVCGDPEYVKRFPRNAFTRLKHLLKSEAGTVRRSAIAAIITAAQQVSAVLVTEQLAEWSSQRSDDGLRDVVPEILAALLDDELVRQRWRSDLVDRDRSGAVRSLWRSILVTADASAVRECVSGWLVLAAGAKPQHRPLLTDRLVDAAAGHFWMLGQLSQAVSERAWAQRDAGPDVLTLRDRLSHHLAQAKVSF